jgi:MFS family permease
LWGGLGRPAFSASLVDILGPTARLRGMNLNYWAINLGFSGAAILAGVLSSAPRTAVFTLNALALGLSAVLIAIKLPETRPPGPAPRDVVGRPDGTIGMVLRDRTFMIFVTLNLGLWIVIESCKLLPIAMIDKGLDPADYGAVIAVNGVMIVVGQLFIPKLVARRRRTHVLVAAGVLVGVGMGAVAVAGTVGALAVTVMIWTLGEMLNAPINGTYVADLSRPTMRGRYQGIASMSFTLANFISPVVGALVLDHTPPATLWLGLLTLALLVAAIQWITGPSRERRAADLTRTIEGVRREPVAA